MIAFVIDVLATVPKGLGRSLKTERRGHEKLGIRGRMLSDHTTASLRSVRILVKVLET